MQWIIALRPLSGIATSLLVVSGFRHSNLPINWAIVVAIFLLASSAFVWNDYYDRETDVAKGRLLASTHPASFRGLALSLLAISLAVSLYVSLRSPASGFLCLAIWVACTLYPFAQRNALAKNMIVSLTTAATVLFPLLAGSHDRKLWLLAGFIAVVVSAREHAKDVEDIEADRGKKKTFALILKKNISKREAVAVRLVANVLLILVMFR